MNKTYKKSDIDKYVGAIKNEHVGREEDLNELVGIVGLRFIVATCCLLYVCF